jgi:anti-anti-sigma regulatory factor
VSALLKVCGATVDADVDALADAGAHLVGLWHGVPGGHADLPLDGLAGLAARARERGVEPVLVTFLDDAGALADVVATHPLVHAPQDVPPFRLFFDDECLALAGSVDTFSADRLSRLLATSPVRGPVATLDLTFLDFLDGAGCRAIARWVRELGARSIAVELRSAPRVVQRMWSILDFGRLAPVTFTGAGA